ncbi:energy-coupling factor ABC transporter substrate-binding protein [Streptomyces sp. NPDC096351]|uniref:energy-coupling factor ABC transporter substrate-binding protein n=1 Tax=Streptomyces sp. NPDC096351 TaxID=3366087 RepID=UPI003813097D
MSRNAKINTLLLLVVAALAVLPLALGLGDHKEEPFVGADAEAETAITELRPDYEPWFSPLYEPPSGEIESALFALQAALGAGVLAYYFGLRRGRRQGAARVVAEGSGTDVADGADGAGAGAADLPGAGAPGAAGASRAATTAAESGTGGGPAAGGGSGRGPGA